MWIIFNILHVEQSYSTLSAPASNDSVALQLMKMDIMQPLDVIVVNDSDGVKNVSFYIPLPFQLARLS